MKIYILRHEDRTDDCSFFAPLTKLGLEKSNNLVNIINECKINKIFSSPFIRTLQTIDPFVRESKLPVNIEYGLEEINHEDIIPKKAAGITLPEYLAEIFNYNPNYKSHIKPSDINYPEKTEHVQKRVKRLLRNILSENFPSEDNILLVTHQGVCTTILEIVKKAKPELKISIEEYGKGKLSLVYDNDWIFKMIN
jgi:broad specificity phosphatase PhoE